MQFRACWLSSLRLLLLLRVPLCLDLRLVRKLLSFHLRLEFLLFLLVRPHRFLSIRLFPPVQPFLFGHFINWAQHRDGTSEELVVGILGDKRSEIALNHHGCRVLSRMCKDLSQILGRRLEQVHGRVRRKARAPETVDTQKFFMQTSLLLFGFSLIPRWLSLERAGR